MLNEKFLRKKPSENDWVEVTVDDVHHDYGLPIDPVERLLHRKILYSRQYIYRLESTPYKEYPKDIKLIGDVMFRNQGGNHVNWSEKMNGDENMIEQFLGGAYNDQWKGRLMNSEIISFPLGYVYLSTNPIQDCPKCGTLFQESRGGLSRRDNETLICSSCELQEAFEDMEEADKVKIKLYTSHLALVKESLLREFEEATGIKRKTEWIKQKAFEDFGIVLESSEDIPKLDKHVRANFYEDKAEWLKEKMRRAIQGKDEALEEVKMRIDQQFQLKDPRIQEHNLQKIKTVVEKL